jgi:arachidonate 15-lipoxygenase
MADGVRHRVVRADDALRARPPLQRRALGVRFGAGDYPERSGLRAAGIDPTGAAHLEAMYALFEAHALDYLRLYYASDADLAADGAVTRRLDAYDQAIPNGLPAWTRPLTIASLARLIAVLIYVGVVEHELRRSVLWNYQLWTHVQPIRVYRDGRREPVDVYQRLVNSNMILNTTRAPLLQDFSYLATERPRRRGVSHLPAATRSART